MHPSRTEADSLAALFDALDAPVLVCAGDGVIAAANAAAARCAERAGQALVGRRLETVLSVDDGRGLALFLAGGAPGAVECGARFAGDATPRRARLVRLSADDGAWTLVVAQAADGAGGATARRADDERYRALFEGAADAVFLLSDRIIDCNSRGAELLAAPREALRGRPLTDFWPATQPDGRRSDEAAAEHIAAALRGQAVQFCWQCVRADGEALDVEVSLAGVQAGGERLLHACVRDVTERKRIEAALRTSEARYRGLFETSRDGIAFVTLDGRFEDANAAFLDMLGYSLDELRQLRYQQFTPQRWAEMEAEIVREKILKLGFADDYEKEFVRQDGKVISVQVRAWLVRDHAGRPVRMAGVVRDLSARRRSEEEKRNLESQLVRAQRMEAVGQLAGGLAHDFNNVLTAIVGNAELLRHQFDPQHAGDAGRLAQVEQIEQAAQRAAQLTRQMLSFSRHQSAVRELVDVNRILRDLEPMLRRVIPERVEIELALAPALPAVRADPAQLEQVVMNLVVNARDAMLAGGRLTLETASATLDAAAVASRPDAAAGPHVLLIVRDTGCGMSSDVLERIFEPFFTTKPVGLGTGLGLSTVYGIVKNFGGHLVAYSEVGRGSSFEVYLPAAAADAPRPVAPPPEEHALTGTETVLVCEDDDTVRDLTVRFLRSAGYSVLAARSADEAAAEFKRNVRRVHLLVADVVMPGRSGRELSAELRRLDPWLQTIFISGYAAGATAPGEAPIPPEQLLEKPFSRRLLLERVRAALTQRGG